MSYDIPAKQRITFEVDTWGFLEQYQKLGTENNAYRFESLCVDPERLSSSLGLALYGIEIISVEPVKATEV